MVLNTPPHLCAMVGAEVVDVKRRGREKQQPRQKQKSRGGAEKSAAKVGSRLSKPGRGFCMQKT
jgi:hypothetical protein